MKYTEKASELLYRWSGTLKQHDYSTYLVDRDNWESLHKRIIRLLKKVSKETKELL